MRGSLGQRSVDEPSLEQHSLDEHGLEERSPWVALAHDLDEAHARAAGAAAAGLADAALGPLRLAGPGVAVLADAAVSSATPFLRAPLMARLHAVAQLHPDVPEVAATCPSCGVPTPCPTARSLFGTS